MLDSLLSLFSLLAHGADPRPISGSEATANLVKFFVTIVLALLMSYPILAPLFPAKGEVEGEEQPPPTERTDPGSGLVGWVGVALAVVLSMAWWLTRTSIVELTAAETPMPDHRHTQERGGQVAMWGDFHAEVARIESGEVRVFLTDSYNRPIAARFFDAEITPFDAKRDAAVEASRSAPKPEDNAASTPSPMASATPTDASVTSSPPTSSTESEEWKTHPTIPALDDSYRFTRLSRDDKAYRVKVKTPGWSVTLKFQFDNSNGRRSLPIWCGTPGAE